MRTVAIASDKTGLLAALFLASGAVSVAFGGDSETISKDEAFKQGVERIIKVLPYGNAPYACLRIRQVTWNGQPASAAILRRTTWQLKFSPQSADASIQMETEAMKLPEAERLKTMDRFDDHIQVWGVELPADAEPYDKATLVADPVPHRQHRELFYLGRDKDFAWYAFMPIDEFAQVESQLSLKGEDVLPALIRGVVTEDLGSDTAYSCGCWLSHEGARALKPIDDAIAARLPQRTRLVWAMRSSRDEAVTRWLVGLSDSTDADVAATARHTLVALPRQEAVPLYAKWLAEGAGQREVTRELEACRKFKVAEAATSLPKVLATPASVKEYRLALEMSHEFAGKPAMPADALAAEERIEKSGYGSGSGFDQQKVNEAVDEIVASADVDAAAAIGMSLAVSAGKGDTPAVRQAGVKILRRLPDGKGKRLATLLAQTNRLSWQAEEVKAAAKAVNSQ